MKSNKIKNMKKKCKKNNKTKKMKGGAGSARRRLGSSRMNLSRSRTRTQEEAEYEDPVPVPVDPPIYEEIEDPVPDPVVHTTKEVISNLYSTIPSLQMPPAPVQATVRAPPAPPPAPVEEPVRTPIRAQDEALSQQKQYKYIATLGTTGVNGRSNSEFNDPRGVAISADGNKIDIYVADTVNNRVQVFPRFDYIESIISIYNHGIKKFYMSYYTVGKDGYGHYRENEEFLHPMGVAFSDALKCLYVADTAHHRVQVFNILPRDNYSIKESYVWKATLGMMYSEGVSNKQFNNPMGVTVSVVDNRIYIADTKNNRVQVFNGITNAYITTIGNKKGESGNDKNHFNNPTSVAVSSHNRIYVTDTYNNRVQVFDGNNNYKYITTLGDRDDPNKNFKGPIGVAVSLNIDNRLYVADTNNNCVKVFDCLTLDYIDTLGTSDNRRSLSDNMGFDRPCSVAISYSDNRIYVVDSGNSRVQVYQKLPSSP
jgi:DNA-binding beta-propeller fold protein YncE